MRHNWNRRETMAALVCLAGCGAAPAGRTAPHGQARADPLSFGAKGIGRAFNDQPAIQRAVDYVWQQGGGSVVFRSPPSFYHAEYPIMCRPGVSLIGDGSFPSIRGFDDHTELLLPGNFHPDFVSRARFDPLERVSDGATTIALTDERAARRYRVGDQVLVASRDWGKTEQFGIPKYAWLNYVTGVGGRTLQLREPIDQGMEAGIALLCDTPARHGIPLFFYADARIEGLHFQSPGYVMSDSAMLRVDVRNNRIDAASGMYGNTSQYVTWAGNTVHFSASLGEQSLCSLSTVIRGNRFVHAPRGKERRETGFYFQEYARKLQVIDNSVEFADVPTPHFLLSIAAAQNVTVERLRARGLRWPGLVFMGASGSEGFPVTGNWLRDCDFDVAQSDRFVLVKGEHSPFMRDNGVQNCRFTGAASAPDAFRVEATGGAFTLQDNVWPEGDCLTMNNSRLLHATGNRRGANTGSLCRAIS